MDYWRPKAILIAIILYVSGSIYEPIWRLFVRGLIEGNSFTWSYIGIGGSGVSGGYWVIVLFLAIGLFILFIGWRGAKKLFRWFVSIWVFILFSSSIALLIHDPKAKIIAESLQIELPYAIIILPFDVIACVLLSIWLIRERHSEKKVVIPPWNRINTMYLLGVISIFPIEFFVFNVGDQHGLLDKVGVLLTFIQWIMINLSFYPWKGK